jgi:hypothetical protein
MKPTDKIHERLAEIPAAQVSGTVFAIVDDPYSHSGGQIAVLRATRDDPLAAMLARGSIDQAQYHAGREWQRTWENAGIGAVRAIDPTKEPVSGSGPRPDPITDRQRRAVEELRTAQLMLGYEGDRLVREILGDRVALADAAQRHGWAKKFTGQRFKECLETMAKLWGFA